MNISKAMWTIGWICLLAGCADAGATSAPKDPPARDSPTGGGGKADIYGVDDRQDYYESSDPLMREVADSTAVLVRPFRIHEGDSEHTRRLVDDTFAEERGLCDSEPYRDQRAPGFCTGFLVAPDVLATAGHCVKDLDGCKDTRFVFGFRYESADDDPTLVDAGDIYGCRSLLARQKDDAIGRHIGTDWALVRLDRAVDDRVPLSLRDRGELAAGEAVAIVGHPSGLPLKISAGGRVIDASSEVYFSSDLDTYGGNSGSPVVNWISGVVEGVHVRGTHDFVETDAGCSVSRVCDEVGEEGCGGNSAVRAGRFRAFVAPPAESAGWVRADADRFERVEDAGGGGALSAPRVAWHSSVQLDASGTVDFVTIDVDTNADLPPGARVYLQRGDDMPTDLTRSYLGRRGLAGEAAVAAMYGEPAGARWTLRVVMPEDEPVPELHGWALAVHLAAP